MRHKKIKEETKVELELFGTRGGIGLVIHDYTKANTDYIERF